MSGTAALDEFQEQRQRLFGIAYRMLGTVSDAEDIVQETWIRWQNADRTEIREPGAFLATVATRLSINATQSAHARRETYIGPWLPEPVNTDADPALVGKVALEAGVPLTELRAEDAGLEDMFLELTATSQREGATS